MRLFQTVLLAAIAATFGTSVVAQGRPAGVQTEWVTMQTMAETTTVFGQVVAERESAVASRVAGIAASVPVRVGSELAEGDVLARMDTELLSIELAQAESQLAIAQAGLEVAQVRADNARKTFERAQSLRATSSIADAQFEDRASAYAEAQGARAEANARIAAARNAVDRAAYNLKNAEVRAPFDGVVLEVATEEGQFVAQGSTVAVLLDVGALEVLVNVPSRLIDGLRPGLPVAARTDSGLRMELRLRAVLPTEFSATRTRPVIFEFAAGTQGVAVGQSITLDVPVGAEREVVAVPKDALVQARGGWSAFVNDNGKASPRTVVIGASLGDSFEVLSGLLPGDEVVVRGNERLRPGQDIAPMRPGEGGSGGGRPPAANSGDGDGAGAPETTEEGANTDVTTTATQRG